MGYKISTIENILYVYDITTEYHKIFTKGGIFSDWEGYNYTEND